MTAPSQPASVNSALITSAPSWPEKVDRLVRIAPGLRLVFAFTATSAVSTFFILPFLKDPSRNTAFDYLVAFGLFLTPLVWRGGTYFFHALTTCAAVALMLALIKPGETVAANSDKPVFIFFTVGIASIRGLLLPRGRLLVPLSAGICGVIVGLALSFLRDGKSDHTLWVLCIVCFWCGAACGYWLESLSPVTPSPAKKFKHKTFEASLLASPQSLHWRWLLKAFGLAIGMALCVDQLYVLLQAPRKSLSTLTLEVLVVACLMLITRGLAHFGSAFLTSIPLFTVVMYSSNTPSFEFGLALLLAWMWGTLHGRALPKAIANIVGFIICMFVLLLMGPSLRSSLEQASPEQPIIQALQPTPVWVSVIALAAVALQIYPLAIDALVDWLFAKEDGGPASPSVKPGALTDGDLGLLRARILFSDNVVRVLALGVLILAATLPWSLMRLRSSNEDAAPLPGRARPELIIVALGADYDPFSLTRWPPRLQKWAISRARVSFGELQRVTGLRPLHRAYDHDQAAILDNRWQGLPYDAALAYCDELSLLEGLEPCYREASQDHSSRKECTGYQLLTLSRWDDLISTLRPDGSDSIIADTRDDRELVRWTHEFDSTIPFNHQFAECTPGRASYSLQGVSRLNIRCDVASSGASFRVARILPPGN